MNAAPTSMATRTCSQPPALIDQAGRARETARSLAPPRDLEPIVAECWIQGYTDVLRAERRSWRVVPDLQPHLIVHRHVDGRTQGPRVVGARSTWLDTRVAARAWSAGLTLRPGVLPAVAGLPAPELVDLSAGPDEIWGKRGAVLRDSIEDARSPQAAIEILLAFLRERAAEPRAVVDWRVRGFTALAAGPGKRGVGEIAAELGVAPRTLRSVWRAEVGLSPREALSIDRVHRAVACALARPAPSHEPGPRRGPRPGRPRPIWAGVARTVGFYDQAHMIRDFRRFLGETPERFLARGGAERR